MNRIDEEYLSLALCAAELAGANENKARHAALTAVAIKLERSANGSRLSAQYASGSSRQRDLSQVRDLEQRAHKLRMMAEEEVS